MYVSGVRYHPGGGMKDFTYGNGIVHSMETNARQMPSRVVDSHGAIDVQYEYDVDGNPSAILDIRDATRTRTLTYDGRGRLITAASPSFGGAGVFNYWYDALDNLRAARLDGGRHYDYDYDARNRLTNIRNQRGETIIGLNYDARGNLRRRNAVGYMFDTETGCAGQSGRSSTATMRTAAGYCHGSRRPELGCGHSMETMVCCAAGTTGVQVAVPST